MADILLVDDDDLVLNGFSRALKSVGHAITEAHDGREALNAIASQAFDVVVSDVAMPGLDGPSLLRELRAGGQEVPVIFVAGCPDVASAASAVEFGAFRYLAKPVSIHTLRDTVERAANLSRFARIKRELLDSLGLGSGLISDLETLERALGRALSSLWMAHQPIVAWGTRQIFGFEALMRFTEPALPHPGALLAAAEKLARVHDVGRTVRAAIGVAAADAPPGVNIFVNLHARDLLDEDLFDRQGLARYADRIVLEITERAALEEVRDLRPRVSRLRELGFRIAVDDLGAGYAGLTSFAQLEPDIVKLDMSLVRGVDTEPMKQRLISAITGVCRDMKIQVVAEGIETVGERDTIVSLGCDLLQGYLFAKPARGFPDPKL